MPNLPSFTSYTATGCPGFHPRDNPFIGGTSNSFGDVGAGQNSELPSSNIFERRLAYQSCQQFFLDYAQHQYGVQALAALINICLPFQWPARPILNSTGPLPHPLRPAAHNAPWPRLSITSNSRDQLAPERVSLVPYIRRLIITGMDKEGTMQCLFGDDWRNGVGSLHKCERRNYLFAAKGSGWAKTKDQYDMSPHESVPFLEPLQDVQLAEIEGAEELWSQWLAMEDWMVGPRAPDLTWTW